jgi:hypothetical protein
MVTPDTWKRFVDDASPLETDARRRASPVRGDRLVLDEELPALGRYAGDVRLVVTGGAGQVAGPAAHCRRHGVEVSALDLAVRDLDEPAGNVRRLVAAVDQAVAAGDLLDDTVVHLRVRGELGSSWAAALDAVAEVEWVVALPLDGADPEPWIDAAMDRETPVSLVGGTVEQAVAALTTAARLWGDETDLAAARRWVRSWATADPDTALEHLQGL